MRKEKRCVRGVEWMLRRCRGDDEDDDEDDDEGPHE